MRPDRIARRAFVALALASSLASCGGQEPPVEVAPPSPPGPASLPGPGPDNGEAATIVLSVPGMT